MFPGIYNSIKVESSSSFRQLATIWLITWSLHHYRSLESPNFILISPEKIRSEWNRLSSSSSVYVNSFRSPMNRKGFSFLLLLSLSLKRIIPITNISGDALSPRFFTSLDCHLSNYLLPCSQFCSRTFYAISYEVFHISRYSMRFHWSYPGAWYRILCFAILNGVLMFVCLLLHFLIIRLSIKTWFFPSSFFVPFLFNL